MAQIQEGKTCPHCGAPVTTEICPFCGTPTGLNTAQADMEYPELECKEASLGFFTLIFPLIFALSFGLCGLFLFFSSFTGSNTELGTICISILLLLIGGAATYIVIARLYGYLAVKHKGKTITGVVYGYMDDKVMYNNSPGQVVKILVDSKQGKRFILYQLGSIEHPYKINSTIELSVYKNYFIINTSKESAENLF